MSVNSITFDTPRQVTIAGQSTKGLVRCENVVDRIEVDTSRKYGIITGYLNGKQQYRHELDLVTQAPPEVRDLFTQR